MCRCVFLFNVCFERFVCVCAILVDDVLCCWLVHVFHALAVCVFCVRMLYASAG
jgi:hypothetical protein